MHYIGRLTGNGILFCDGDEVGRTAFDFDGFQRKPGDVIGSGEIRPEAGALKIVFGRRGVQLHTDDGHMFDLRFTEKELRATNDAAHVDVGGEELTRNIFVAAPRKAAAAGALRS